MPKESLEKIEKREAPEQLIRAEDKEGKEVEFNLEQIKDYWLNFYKDHNLGEIAESLKDIEIRLTNEQIETLKQKTKEGFNRFILLPSVEIQQIHLANIKRETERELPGLDKKEQYNKEEGIWFSDVVKLNLPDKIIALNRPKDKPYFLFVRDEQEVSKATLDKSALKLRKMLKDKKETSLTLAEYLIFQRDYTERHQNENKPHLSSESVALLLDSELGPDSLRISPDSPSPTLDSRGGGRVLYAHWEFYNQRVDVISCPPDEKTLDCGTYSSVVFKI